MRNSKQIVTDPVATSPSLPALSALMGLLVGENTLTLEPGLYT